MCLIRIFPRNVHKKKAEKLQADQFINSNKGKKIRETVTDGGKTGYRQRIGQRLTVKYQRK